jgi:hypothetical protein
VHTIATYARIGAGFQSFDRVNVTADNEALHDSAGFPVLTGVAYLIDYYDNGRTVDF